MRRMWIALLALMVIGLGASAAAQGALDDDLVDLVQWLGGEFDSTEAWQAAGAGDAVPRRHLRIGPAISGEDGRWTAAVALENWDGGWHESLTGTVTVATTPSFDGLVMRPAAATAEPSAAIQTEADPTLPAADPFADECVLLWHREGAAFTAELRGDACDGAWLPAVLGAAARLDREQLVVTPRTTGAADATPPPPIPLRRCTFYDGKFSIRGADGKSMTGVDYVWHDQGAERAVPISAGAEAVYALRLTNFRAPHSGRRSLRLELLEHGTAVAAAATDSGADSVVLVTAAVSAELRRAGYLEGGGLLQLVDWMTGSFSSAAQAAGDQDFRDIRLHMKPIWPGQGEGYWLYVEQAVAEYADRPYRQRVYHVTEVAPNLYESQVLALPDPAAAIGAWRDPERLGELSPDDLETREGCAILLRRRGDAFIGSTLGSLCTSTLRGAAYATSEVTLTADGLVSWDRGFDRDGRQVWGAERGGYVFDRASMPEPTSGEAGPADAEAAAGGSQ